MRIGKEHPRFPPGLFLLRAPLVFPSGLLRTLLALGPFLFSLAGCSYYSFTGASLPPHLNTVAIPLVEDASTSPLTNLGDDLTRLLIERFVDQTRLKLEPDENEADALLTARIDRYVNAPTSVTAAETALLNRVTIYVTVTYLDRVNNEELLRRSFSGYAEYNPQQLDEEVVAAQAALLRVADDIFTAATSNW